MSPSKTNLVVYLNFWMLSQDEFAKMKAELEAEYLATFKKTVAMHEMFLQRLASHMIFKNDANFRVFLTYKDDLSVRGRNKAS